MFDHAVAYEIISADLEKRRESVLGLIAESQQKLSSIEATMALLRETYGTLPTASLASVPGFLADDESSYRNMSMRWAILKLFAENPMDSLPTSEIANRILKGGFPNSSNFNSKVSAILGQMVGKKEVEKDGADWTGSTHGEDVWNSIKVGDKYKTRHSGGRIDDLD